MLSRREVDVNLANKAGLTALHLACQTGDIALVVCCQMGRLIQKNYTPSIVKTSSDQVLSDGPYRALPLCHDNVTTL